MARLEHTQPLVCRDRGMLRQALADARVKVHVDEETRLAYDIEGDSGDGLKVDMHFGAASGTLATVTVAVGQVPTAPVIQRFNRLFKDLTGELLWYHRSGDVQYHLPGTFMPLPVEVRWTPDAVTADRLQYRQGSPAASGSTPPSPSWPRLAGPSHGPLWSLDLSQHPPRPLRPSAWLLGPSQRHMATPGDCSSSRCSPRSPRSGSRPT